MLKASDKRIAKRLIQEITILNTAPDCMDRDYFWNKKDAIDYAVKEFKLVERENNEEIIQYAYEHFKYETLK